MLQGVTGTVGITGTVPVSGEFYQTYQGVTGQVAVSNFPVLQGVTGTVGITGTVIVKGEFYPTYQGVTGQVAVSNFPAAGQALAASSVPVCLPVDQLNTLKPLATQPVSGSVDITGSLPFGTNYLGAVQVNNPTIEVNANTISVSQTVIGQWYSISTIGTTTTLQWQTLGVEPVLYRTFKALVTETTGTGTVTLQLYNENVKVSNFPPYQGVTGTVGITGTVPVSGTFYPTYQGVTGQVAISNFPPYQGVTGTVGITGTVPVSGTFYPTYQGVTGQVAISNFPPYQGITGTVGIAGTVQVSGTFNPEYQGVSGTVAISNYPSTQSTKIVPTSDIPFVSRSLGNTGLVVAGLSKVLRNLSLAKSDDILTYVYIYDKATAATSGDTPIFLFIIKNFVGIQLTLNHLFLLGISIRATSNLNGTTSPTADTVFANITFSTP